MTSAMPRSARISIVRWCSTCALGSTDVLGSELTSSESTPRRDSSMDAVRPAPPPPTIRTSVCRSVIAHSILAVLAWTESARYDSRSVRVGHERGQVLRLDERRRHWRPPVVQGPHVGEHFWLPECVVHDAVQVAVVLGEVPG